MNQVLRNFFPRAPRYVLRPGDNRFLRFSHSEDGQSHTESTRLLNLSETGLGFVIDNHHAPRVGESIKVEFPIPGDDQMAWFARVVRIEEYSPPKSFQRKIGESLDDLVVVGVKFTDLPDGHRKSIRHGLNIKFNEVLKERHKDNLFQLGNFIAAHFWKGLLYLGLSLATVLILYFFSRPDANYDEDKGAPWGQRYPQLNFFTPKDDSQH